MKNLFSSKEWGELSFKAKVNNDNFRLSWLRLSRSKNVGPKTFIDLIKIFGDPEIALENIDSLAKKGGKENGTLVPPKSQVIQEMVETEKQGGKLILACDDIYPRILLQLADFPPVIIAKGNLNLLSSPKFAIVGARNSSLNGAKISRNFSAEIAQAGYVIVSGLAKGIDAAAHIGSVEYGTIGVIAGGVTHIYPKENKKLFHMLYAQGLVLTEQPIGQVVKAKHFPQRNRIIAGLSLGVLVVEAAKKSGTLITARFALDYNREIFAVPGSPLDVRCQGTNDLIKNGAHLVQYPLDIINVLNSMYQNRLAELNDNYGKVIISSQSSLPQEEELNKYREKLLVKLSFSPISIQDIINEFDIPINILNCLLLELELAGKVSRSYGDQVMLTISDD